MVGLFTRRFFLCQGFNFKQPTLVRIKNRYATGGVRNLPFQTTADEKDLVFIFVIFFYISVVERILIVISPCLHTLPRQCAQPINHLKKKANF